MRIERHLPFRGFRLSKNLSVFIGVFGGFFGVYSIELWVYGFEAAEHLIERMVL